MFTCEWEYYWDPLTDSLWKMITEGHYAVCACKHKNGRIRRYQLEHQDNNVEIPETVLPVDATKLKKWYQISIPKFYDHEAPIRIWQKLQTDRQESSNDSSTCTELNNWGIQQPLWSKRMMQNINDMRQQNIAEGLHVELDEQVYLVSDGGLRD